MLPLRPSHPGRTVQPTLYKLTQITRDSGLSYQPSISADGKFVVYASDRATGKDLDIWLQQISGGQPVRLTATPGDEFHASLSADGRRVAFEGSGQEPGIFVVPALGGSPRLVASAGKDAQISPDGMSVAYATGWYGQPSEIHVVLADGGSDSKVSTGLDWAMAPIWTRDGRHLLLWAAHAKPVGYDYWMVPARTATGDVEWPRDGVTNEPLLRPCHGVHHHFAKLALLSFDGASWSLRQDCRQLFPPLTDITAADVSFNNTVCDFEAADTVQEALDSLCQRLRSRCTLVARPGDDLQALFDSIGAGQDAHVCFCVGTFQLSTTINVSGKGHLHISGAGAGSRLVAATQEAALIFQNCRGVVVEDLYAETGAAGRSGARNHLNGTLTFLNCEAVTVQGVGLRSGAGAERLAACLTVRDERSETIQGLSRCAVRVLHCNFEVGHQQSGILLANVGRSVVEDNFLRVAPRPQGVTLSSLAENLRLRARLRRLLVSNFSHQNTQITLVVLKGFPQLQLRSDEILQFGLD
jgi:hypothetical protein